MRSNLEYEETLLSSSFNLLSYATTEKIPQEPFVFKLREKKFQEYLQVFLLRGIAFSCMGQFKEAKACFELIIDRDNNNPEAYIHLGRMYINMKMNKSLFYFKNASKRSKSHCIEKCLHNISDLTTCNFSN